MDERTALPREELPRHDAQPSFVRSNPASRWAKERWIWMADHSNQVGSEKALIVLGIRASQLPKPGTPL